MFGPGFRIKFRVSDQILALASNFGFGIKFGVLTKFQVSDQNLGFGPKSRFWGKFLFLTDPDWTPGPPQGGSNPPLSSSDLGQILLSLNPVKGRLQN